jgi:multiple sugar transport system substrate-binding protein
VTGTSGAAGGQTFTTWFQYDQTNTDPKADEAAGNAYLAAEIPQFNQQFAGKWNWVNVPQAFDKMQALLITAVQSGGEVPDLFDADNIPMNAFIKNGAAQDLTAWAQQQSWYSQLDPSALSTCKGPDGKLYCIPVATQPYVVFVWKELWPLGYPKTPESFMTEAARLKTQGHYAMTFFGSTDFEGEAINRFMSMAVLSYGGTFDDGKGNMLLNTPEDVAAVQMMRNIVSDGYVPEIAFAGQFAEENAIKDASAASFPTGLFGYRYLNPLTAPDGKQFNTGTQQDMLNAINAGEIYLAPLFAPDGKTPSCNLGADSFVIPTGAKNVDAAHDFINWMMDPAQNPGYVTGPGGGFPALKSSLSAPLFQAQFYKEAADVLSQSPCRPWYGSLQDIPRAQKEIVDTFYDLIKANPTEDIATALQNTQDQYNAGN